MDELPETECAEEPANDLPYDDQEMDDWPSSAESEAHAQSLAGSEGLSLGLSLLALLSIAANHQVAQFLRGQTEPNVAISLSAAVFMGLALLIAAPSWIAAVVFALGSLVTVQRRWGLALLALLVSAVSAAVFLLAD